MKEQTQTQTQPEEQQEQEQQEQEQHEQEQHEQEHEPELVQEGAHSLSENRTEDSKTTAHTRQLF